MRFGQANPDLVIYLKFFLALFLPLLSPCRYVAHSAFNRLLQDRPSSVSLSRDGSQRSNNSQRTAEKGLSHRSTTSDKVGRVLERVAG